MRRLLLATVIDGPWLALAGVAILGAAIRLTGREGGGE